MGILVKNNIVYGSTPPVDNTISDTSENPVQNKTIFGALALKADKTELPTIDSSLSTESENPVQNKIITVPLNTVTNKVIGINTTDTDYLELTNNKRLYISDTVPTGTIPDGAFGIGF